MADVLKTIRMPRHLLETWLAALRSGKYEQGEGALEFDGSFCCLGVLQHAVCGRTVRDDYHNEELPDQAWLDHHGITFSNRHGALTNNPFIPSRDTSVAALNDAVAEDPTGGDELKHSNDFNTIADLIELHAEAVD